MTKREQPNPEPKAAANPYATQMVSAAPPSAALLLQDEAGQPLRIVPLNSPTLSVGRLPISGLVLDAPMISRNHLQIAWNGHEAHVTDLESTSGTLLGGVRLAAHVATLWKPGQVLQLGPYRVELHLGPQLSPTLAHPTAMEAAAPPASAAPAEAAPTRALQALPPTDNLAVPPPAVDIFAAPPPRAVEAPAVTHILDDQATHASLKVVTGPSLSVVPGQRAVASVLVINRAAAAERYVFGLEGVPPEWVQLPAPLAIGAGEQAMATIMVMVPIETTSTARVYPVTLSLNSQGSGVLVDHTVMEWSVQPFTDARIALDPKRIVGRERAVYNIGLTNTGNAPARFAISADEEEADLNCSLDLSQVLVEPGQTLQLPLKVQVGQRLIGNQRRYSFTVKATTQGLRPLTAAGVFVQQAVISTWMLVVGIIVLAAIAVLVIQLTDIIPEAQSTTILVAPALAVRRFLAHPRMMKRD